VTAVSLLCLDQDQGAVAEHRVVAVKREQLLLLSALLPRGFDGRGVEALDATHDQAGLDVVGLASAGERQVRGLGDLGVADEALLLVVPDRVRIGDGRPVALTDAADRGAHPGGDGETDLRAAGRGDHVVVVEGTVGTKHDQPFAAGAAGTGDLRRDECVCDQTSCAAGGVGAALTQAGRADHRRRQRGGDGRDQRVQALHSGVAVTGALLGVAVGRLHGVIDVDVGDLTHPSQSLLTSLKPGMLLLVDRGFFSFALWRRATATGADLLWLTQTGSTAPQPQHVQDLPDGSWLSHLR
jgi:hypothetical protein